MTNRMRQASRLPCSSPFSASALLLTAALAGCSMDTGGALPPGARAVERLALCTTKIAGYHHLAALLPYEGAWPIGEPTEHALLQAVLEINAAGGIGRQKRPLGLVACNTRGDPATAARAMREVARATPISAVVGPMASAEAQAVAEVAAEEGMVVLAPAASSVTQGSDAGWLRRIAPSAAELSRVAAQIIKDAGLPSSYVIYPEDPDGAAIAAAYKDAFSGDGRTVGSAGYRSDDTGFALTTTLAAIGYSPVSVFLIGAPADAAAIVRAANNRAFRPRWLFSPALRTGEFSDAVDNNAFLEGGLGLGAGVPTRPEMRVFVDAYTASFGKPPEPYGAHAYDAVYLLAAAMTLADDPDDRARVRDALARTRRGPVVRPGGWASAASAVHAGATELNYEGASGPVDLEESGGVESSFIEQWVFTAGGFNTVACWPTGQQPCP